MSGQNLPKGHFVFFKLDLLNGDLSIIDSDSKSFLDSRFMSEKATKKFCQQVLSCFQVNENTRTRSKFRSV